MGEQDDSRAIWDPLWEYVLDDYDDQEITQPTRARQRKRRKSKKEEESKGFDMDNFFLMDGGSGEENDLWQSFEGLDVRDDKEDLGGSWTWGSGESSQQHHETSKRHPWRRNKSKQEERIDEEGGSMWDLFVAPEAPTDQQKQKKPLKSSLKRSPESKSSLKKTSDTNRGNSETTGQSTAVSTRRMNETRKSSQASNDKVTAAAKPKRAGFFKRRFSKQQEESTIELSSRQQQQLQKEAVRTESRSSAPTQYTPERRSKKEHIEDMQQSVDESRDSYFDPLSMLFEVAEKLDPWATDSDSNSETTADSDRTDQSDEDRTLPSVEETPPPPPRSSPQRENSSVTEIRLQYKHHEDRDDLEENSLIAQRQAGSGSESEGTSSLPVAGPRGKINYETMKPVQLRREDAVQRSQFLSEEERKGMTFFDPNDQPRNNRIQRNAKSNARERAGLKRLVCCSVKDQPNDNALQRLNPKDAKDVFPATRMISDGDSELASIYGEKADFTNGVMGVPSDRFLGTKGPQSLYAYDYESNEHMDVIYTQFGQSVRKSLFVRKLGPPPALLSSSADDGVVIKVEASTVSETDSIIRKGEWWGRTSAPLPSTPGVDVVGKIYHIKQKASAKYSLVPRQTVVSLIKWGGNTRFLTVDPEQLVKVPEGLDPAQVACLPETYLAAFQTLHSGQTRHVRYRENSLKGKSVLIVGFMSNNMGHAIIELAMNAGAANIYATAKKKHWKTLVAYGVMPLSQDPIEWILRVEGTIDMVLATNGGLREDVTRIHFRALSPTGRLTLCGHRAVGNDAPIGQWEKQHNASLMCTKNKALSKLKSKSHAYDVFEQWETELPLCKADLEHLFKLLDKGAISPTILDRIPLNKVPKAHEIMESKRLTGYLVCEPWMKAKQRAVYM